MAAMVSQVCLFIFSWVTPGPFPGEQSRLKRSQASRSLMAVLGSPSAEAKTISPAVAQVPRGWEWRRQNLH